MTRKTILNLLAACLVSSTIPSYIAHATVLNAAHPFDLIGRDTTECATTGYSPCKIAGIPSNFCCPSNQQCIAFNSNKSAICCPTGQDCKIIAPLSCDITKQNATLSPASQLHSTDLTGTLATCGSQCCPKGYTCQNNNCVVAAAESSTTKAASPTSTSKPTTTGTAKPTSSSITSTPSSSPQNTTTTAASCSNFTPVGVLVGFFSGLLVGVLLTVAFICLCGRRRIKSAKKSGSSVFSSPAATVSDPIYQDDSLRTDFLRRQPQNADAENMAPRRTSRVRSLFSRSPTLSRHNNNGFPLQNSQDGIGRSLQTPMRTPEMRKEPSMESIKIYSPPNIAPNGAGARQTTFTEMMKSAGFRPGEPYVGNPGRVRARSPTSVYSRGLNSNT